MMHGIWVFEAIVGTRMSNQKSYIHVLMIASITYDVKAIYEQPCKV